MRVVGIVGDARERGIANTPGPIAYVCDEALAQFPWFLVRTLGDPLPSARAARLKLRELAPIESVYDISTLDERIRMAQSQDRLRTLLLALFAAAALSLALLGIYGTLSYIVRLRRREVGLRVALGAVSSNVVSHFLARTLKVVVAGCVLGLVVSASFANVLSNMLYGISPTDPITYSGVVLIVVGLATIAALIPALRAARVEPMQVLRED
jgi:ABC-type antimicrobial peptide transport system permease subunit